MAHTTEDNLLINCLGSKVSEYQGLISIGRPYVWALRLSFEDFENIEKAIKLSIHSHSGDYKHLISDEFAPIVVIYLAEWYKRFYKGADAVDEQKALSLNSTELEKIFDLAHIDKNTFVYNASKNPDKTSFRWIESLQVLGGFAIQAELKKEEKADTLLPQLCRIFHGEDLDLSEINDRNRAVAFKESIQKKHSLYEFLDAILSSEKELPFSEEDIKDTNSGIHLFIDRIKNANRQAQKDKFEFEWLVTYSANHAQMVRSLKVKLKPELIGGGLKNYIGYDRFRDCNWGIEHPEEVGRIYFALRFKNGSHCVKEASFKEPLFKFDNTGSAKTGFTAINTLDETVYTDIPIDHFDKVEIVLKYDSTTKTVQTLEVKDYCQLYNVQKSTNQWSSKRNSQSATAVVFSSVYKLAEDFKDLPVVYAHFRNNEAESEDYCWCPINDRVILVDEDGHEVLPPFFNRNGLYQVVTKRYLDTIKYQENLYSVYEYKDLDEDDSEFISDTIPVLFGKEGLVVLHYQNRDAQEGTPVANYDLEWMLPSGRYVDWSKQQPEQGPLRLRVTVQGIVFKYKVYYVPFTSKEDVPKPIWRDFRNSKICTALENVEDIQDVFIRALDAKEPDTKPLVIGPEHSHLIIDVYRPVILRELSQKKSDEKESHIISFSGKDEDIHIPLINFDQFSVRDFSEKGVREYKCKQLNTLHYNFPCFDKTGMTVTIYNAEKSASKLTDAIPLDYLKVYITKPSDNPVSLYAWDYKNEPFPVSSAAELKDDGIVFQSLISDDSPRHYYMPKIKKGNAGWGGKKSVSIKPIDCFLTVSKHKVYYFLFEPLIKAVSAKTMISDIFLPLLALRDFALTKEDTANLYRFAVEFHFDWMLLPRSMWKSQVNEFDTSGENREKIANAIIRFFSDTPKCTDERESLCLNEFLKNYWRFNTNPKVEPIAEKALKLILGDDDALHNISMSEFLIQYDECRFKFIEMSKAIYSTEI